MVREFAREPLEEARELTVTVALWLVVPPEPVHERV
jgi:hypothetical protein